MNIALRVIMRNQIGELFYQKANDSKPDFAKQKYLNVLRLAKEVQLAVGRPAFWIVIRILKKCPTNFSDGLDETVLKRLNRLLIETGFDSVNQELNFDEKLEVRRISLILTSKLWSFCNLQSLVIPVAELSNSRYHWQMERRMFIS